MDAVPVLRKPKDPQVVHVIADWQTIVLHQMLCCLQVRPGRFMDEEIGKQQLAAIVVQRGEERPFLGRIGRSQVFRCIVPYQLADGGGDDLAVGLSRSFGEGERPSRGIDG